MAATNMSHVIETAERHAMAFVNARTRPLGEIAQDIIRNWASPDAQAVVPIYAMWEIRTPVCTDADAEIAWEFLAHAHEWHGDAADRIKAELMRQLSVHG